MKQNIIRSITSVIGLVFLISGCIEVQPSRGEEYYTEGRANGNGVVISAPTSDERVKQDYLTKQEQDRRQTKLLEAESNYNANPDSLPYIIWYGRRLAYLGRYQDGINVFSEGLRKFPRSHKLYRHRGHRFINIRDFDQAIEDLSNAAFYATDAPHEVEPDGIPNALNKPLTNVHWNIWYHLGIAYYLKGNYDKAISSFRKCNQYSNNADLEVKTTNWLYITYRKTGNRDAADALISVVPRRSSLIGSDSKLYHDLITLYRGFYSPERLLTRNTVNNELEANIGYGIGNWFLLEGQVESAQNIFNRVLEGSQRDAFGFIATEVELSSLSNL